MIARDRAVPYSRGDIYLHPSATLDYTTSIGHRTLVEKDCILQKDVQLEETLLGVGCQVGVGSILRDCVVGDHVIIGEGCVLTKCVIMGNVVVGDGVSLTKCTLGERVKISPNVSLEKVRIHK